MRRVRIDRKTVNVLNSDRVVNVLEVLIEVILADHESDDAKGKDVKRVAEGWALSTLESRGVKVEIT